MTPDMRRNLGMVVERTINHKLASRQEVTHGEAWLAIPDVGYIRRRENITGRGPWDTRNMIFRCVVRCSVWQNDVCNQRMLDDRASHLCDSCS